MPKDVIVKIEIVTSAGPKTLERGFDFDEVNCIQTGVNSFSYVLFKCGNLVTAIHESVPVIVYYECYEL